MHLIIAFSSSPEMGVASFEVCFADFFRAPLLPFLAAVFSSSSRFLVCCPFVARCDLRISSNKRYLLAVAMVQKVGRGSATNIATFTNTVNSPAIVIRKSLLYVLQ